MRAASSPPARIWRFLKRTDWPLLPVAGLILAVGLVMQWSVGGAQDFPMGHAVRMAAVGIACAFGAAIPARVWRSQAWLGYAGCILFLISVFVIGDSTNNARRWIDLGGGFKLQPSEFAKLGIILALARYFASRPRPRRMTDLATPALLTVVPFGLILIQPDLGTALSTVPLFLGLVWLAGTPARVMRWFFILPVLLAPFAFLAIQDYQRERIETWWHQDDLSEEEIADAGYHLWHAKLAIGSGGLTGHGWGQGPENRLDRLPERHNDFIFPVIAEEFGLLGSLGFLLLYSLLPITAFLRAARYRDPFTRLVIAGIGVHFATHLCLNVGVSSGAWPTTGLPLPMVSWGGSSMAVSGLLLGVALSVGAAPAPLFERRAYGDDD